MKKVLITGPTGAIGQALVRRCIKEGISVTAVYRPGSLREEYLPVSPLLERVPCALEHLDRLPELIQTRDYDVFFHLGWAGTFGGSRNDLDHQLKNVQYTLDAVEAAHMLNCHRFVGAGSQAEYGRTEEDLSSQTPAFPENGYGAAKLSAGQLSRLRCEQLGVEHIWTRILSVYGPFDGRDTMIMYTISCLLRGEEPVLSGGEQIWDYLYAEDAAEALFLLGEKGISGKTYSVGSGIGRPLREYAEEIRDQIDPEAGLGFGKIPYGPKQVMRLRADLSELKEDTGFSCQYTFREGIARTIQWCREQSDIPPLTRTEEQKRKKISVMVPCYNESENVIPISEAIVEILETRLPQYDYELLFIDNASTDGTREKLRAICGRNPRIKAIFNAANFGQFNSPFYGLCQTTGDCAISMCCDFQDPVEMIPVLVEKWEQGHRIVSCIKTSSRENPLIYRLRTLYYRMIRNMSSVHFLEHFTGFGLYDQTFIHLLRQLEDPVPFLRGIVAEYGESFQMCTVEYEQQERRAGKTHNSFYTLYDAAMMSITSYTKVGLRICTFAGMGCSLLSFLAGLICLILKLARWHEFSAGMAPMLIGMFFLGGVQLFFLGVLGEYILNINTRVINRPVVVEETRINFDDES